jgi:hypothetical protein
MTEQKIGHCLPLYLENRLVLSALEDGEGLPGAADDAQALLASFRERSSEQAVTLLEETYTELLSGAGLVPYKTDRKTQRRTVRDYWYMEGRLYRPRERTARAYWNLYLGCLKGKGGALTFVLGPWESSSPVAMDDLAAQVAPALGLESANPRHCFTHKTGYESGVVAAHAPLVPGLSQPEVIKQLRVGIESFFSKFRTQFDTALEA